MFYILGPARSVEAMARKNGLRKGEWRGVSRAGDIKGRSFGKHDIVLQTHDFTALSDCVDITEYVEERMRGKKAEA